MKTFKHVLFAFAFIAFVGNQTVTAQNKSKAKKEIKTKTKVKSLEQEDTRILRAEEDMKTASPETRAKLEKKIKAYKEKKQYLKIMEMLTEKPKVI